MVIPMGIFYPWVFEIGKPEKEAGFPSANILYFFWVLHEKQ